MYKYSIPFAVVTVGLLALFLHGRLPFVPRTQVAQTQESQQLVILPTPVRQSFHILLIPGHSTSTGGGHFLDIYERDLAVDLAQKIADLLKDNPDFDITMTRNHTAWSEVFSTYFTEQEDAIIAFKTERQTIEKGLLSTGQKKVVPDIAAHSTVDKKTSVQLYGINKWANEHAIDLLLHIHFNDSGRNNYAYPGTFRGFTVYMPEYQLPNSAGSKEIAKNIFANLKTFMSPDVNAVVEDQSLIALGASGTLTQPSILVEYAYIYEKPLLTPDTRDAYLNRMAAETVAGITDYVTNVYDKKSN